MLAASNMGEGGDKVPVEDVAERAGETGSVLEVAPRVLLQWL